MLHSPRIIHALQRRLARSHHRRSLWRHVDIVRNEVHVNSRGPIECAAVYVPSLLDVQSMVDQKDVHDFQVGSRRQPVLLLICNESSLNE